MKYRITASSATGDKTSPVFYLTGKAGDAWLSSTPEDAHLYTDLTFVRTAVAAMNDNKPNGRYDLMYGYEGLGQGGQAQFYCSGNAVQQMERDYTIAKQTATDHKVCADALKVGLPDWADVPVQSVSFLAMRRYPTTGNIQIHCRETNATIMVEPPSTEAADALWSALLECGVDVEE